MTLIVVLFALLVLAGLPIYFVIGVVSAAYFLAHGISPLMVLQRMFVGLDQFVIMAVPMFILTGNIMGKGGATDRLIRLSIALVGHLRGGLAHVNIVCSMLFAGISGAATADVAALGPLEIQLMERGGYKKEYATALTISSSMIGPIIPPSLPLVVYGVVASASIGKLFLGGVLPGVFIGFMLGLLVFHHARKYRFPTSRRASLPELARVLRESSGSLILPLLILVGIYTGWFTPTEAAAIACVYAFVLGKFVYRELAWADMPGILLSTGVVAASTLSIVAIASAFSYIMAIEQVPLKFAQFLLSITGNKYLLLLLINLGMLFLGCFMETLASIIVTAPIFLPIVKSLGMDPIQLGVIMSLNLTMGLLTPPLGINLFIANSITGLPVERIVRANMPFFLVLVVTVLILTYVPQITMFLPNLLMD